jgi:hypothetical protein
MGAKYMWAKERKYKEKKGQTEQSVVGGEEEQQKSGNVLLC